MRLPDDIFRQELMHYLTVYDIVRLDTACVNHQYRPQLLEKITGVILTGEKDESIEPSLYKWLGMRRIYFINVYFRFDTPYSLENDYVDQFKYTRHVVMRGPINDDMAMFIISHSPFLQSIDMSFGYFITDDTLQSIAEHCTGLQSLSLNHYISLSDCSRITDTGLITISEHCPNLLSLKVYECDQITDASIISISIHCTGLQSLHIGYCNKITSVSILAICIQCIGLQFLNLVGFQQITDASIISISTHCTGLQSLNLEDCHQISDASIIPISEKCTGIKRLHFSYTRITDASLIAITKNCTGLQSLSTYGCNSLSSDTLRKAFKSLSELRAVHLSIFPSLPI